MKTVTSPEKMGRYKHPDIQITVLKGLQHETFPNKTSYNHPFMGGEGLRRQMNAAEKETVRENTGEYTTKN